MASTILQQILENVRGGTLLPLDGSPPPCSSGPVSPDECRGRLRALLDREFERLLQAGAGVLALRGVHHCDPRQLERLESVWETLITSELLAGDWVRRGGTTPPASPAISPTDKPIHVATGSFEPLVPHRESTAPSPSLPPTSEAVKATPTETPGSSLGGSGLGVFDDIDTDEYQTNDQADAEAPTDSFTAEDLEAQLEALQTTVKDIDEVERADRAESSAATAGFEETEPTTAESSAIAQSNPPKVESGNPTPGDLLRNSGAAAVLSGAPLASFSPDVLHEIRDLLVTLKEDTGDGILARLQTLTHEVRELSRRPVYAAGPAEDGSNAAESILPEKRVEIDDIQGMIDGLLGT